MNILGSMYLAEDINFIRRVLSDMNNNAICLNTDEANDTTLNFEFPNKVQTATILCPPPSSMYKEIDGEHEAFIAEYNSYLESPPVTDFIVAVLSFMRIGGNIFIYVPSYKEDSIWFNVLCINLTTRFGITPGRSINEDFIYNPQYDPVIAEVIYDHGYMSVFDFINSFPFPVPPASVSDRLIHDLTPFTPKGMNPIQYYEMIKTNSTNTQTPIMPAISFN